MDEKTIESSFCKELVLWKYAFKKHPMQNERIEYRERYCKLLSCMVTRTTGDDIVYRKIFQRLRVSLGLPTIAEGNCQNYLGINIDGFPKLGRRDHRLLLLMETYLLSWLLNKEVDITQLLSYAKKLNLKEKAIILLSQYIPKIFLQEKEMKNALLDKLPQPMLRSILYLNEQLQSEYNRIKTPRYRVAVCGNMSSGKSTILNALLGIKCIPYGNKACTSKIITIENDPESDCLLASNIANNGLNFYTKELDDILDEWNINKEISHIYIWGDITGVRSRNRVLQIYDTPGINSYQNVLHEEITKKFLLETKMDLILYVCNAEHSGTTGEREFLIWLLENIVYRQSTDILFVINKMDSIDSESEDLENFINDIYDNLCEIGFNKPVILPISARAACLFRMMMKNEQMTEKDKIDFKINSKYFCEMNQDFRKFMPDCYFAAVKMTHDICISDDGKLEKNNLLKAIEHTGIPVLERIIEEKLKEDA